MGKIIPDAFTSHKIMAIKMIFLFPIFSERLKKILMTHRHIERDFSTRIFGLFLFCQDRPQVGWIDYDTFPFLLHLGIPASISLFLPAVSLEPFALP
jgi:hypothetical protein